MNPPPLAELQRKFQQILKEGSESTHPDSLWGRDHVPIPYSRRIGIYQQSGTSRFIEAMREDFPQVAKCIGDAEFAKLIQGYLRAHPSRYASISEVGQHLAHFLQSTNSRLPYLAELARYEWFRNEAYWVASPPPLTMKTLQTFVEDCPDHVGFELHPSVRLFECEWQVDRLGTKARLGKVDKVRLLIFCNSTGLKTERLKKNAWYLLKELEKRTTLGELTSFFQITKMNPEAALSLISDWVNSGVLGSIFSKNEVVHGNCAAAKPGE